MMTADRNENIIRARKRLRRMNRTIYQKRRYGQYNIK